MPARYSRNSTALNRTFLEVHGSQQNLSPEESLAVARTLYRDETWDQLLQRPYVVVLGEAGTGKSTEFDRQADQLSAGGHFAFFVEINSLACNGLANSMDPEDRERLEAWRATDARVTFFLDSLDEAKLHRHTLRDALRNLRNAVHAEWIRVALVISCRVSDWMAGADRAEIEALIPQGSGALVHVVQLAPLDSAQVAQLAKHVGVADVSAFMTAIKDSYAQIFIERPLDVKWLGGYWSRYARIGSLRELIDDDIREKLKERPGRVSTLSAAKAEGGLRALAGIATITRRYSFLVPDECFELLPGDSAVDPHEVLRDWSDDEIQQLLRRPIFDEASYGCVRIHHRSVQEFLAARWFNELLSAGMSRTRVESLFLRPAGGEQAIPQHLGPVLAWLCLWDVELRCKMLTEIPALLIGHGDPSGFTDEERRTILQAYAHSYEDRKRQFQRFDLPSLDRFASPVLAKPIASLLSSRETPDDLSAVLLQFVEHGRITECVPIALKLALSAETHDNVRSYAIRSVATAGGEHERRQLLALMERFDVWEQDVAGSFIRALYPSPLGIDGVIRLLGRVTRMPRNQTSSLHMVLEYEIPKLCDFAHRLKFLKALLAQICVLNKEDAPPIDFNNQWLLPAIGKLVEALLDELGTEIEPPTQITDALELFQRCIRSGMRGWYGLDGVRKAVSRSPEVRRALFWRRVEALRLSTGVTPTRQFKIAWSRELYAPSVADVHWLTHDVIKRNAFLERMLAFDVLLHLPRSEVDQARHLDFLREVAATDPALDRRFQRWLNPRPYFDHHIPSYQRQSKARDNARERRHKRDCEILMAQIGILRSGDDIHNLFFLWTEAERHSSGARAVHESLREKYGDEIAEAARDGWRATWRKFAPVLPHTRENRNSTPGTVLLGLTGLHYDFANGLEAATLDESLVIRAAGYAVCELNQFPPWLGDLVQAYPGPVTKVFEPALAADYDSTEIVHDVLAKLSHADVRLRLACASIVAQLVESRDPPTTGALSQALTILLSTENEHALIIERVAEARCKTAIGERPRFAVWWHFWLIFDSVRALDYLEQVLSQFPSADACDLMEKICARLHNCTSDHSILPMRLLNNPATLARLLPLVHAYITLETDIKHEGAHVVGLREHAQDFRDKLPGWIAAIPGEASVAALRRAANNPSLVLTRDWLLHLADQRLITNAGAGSDEAEEMLVRLYREFGLGAIYHLGPLAARGEEMLKIHVGIISFKEEEYAALLDKFKTSSVVSGKNRSYDVAEVGTPSGVCRVAVTRVAQQGTLHAQAAAAELLRDLSPSFVLVVGIAGGVPTPDFGLGDVVVSDYIQDLTQEDTGTGPEERRFNALGGPLHPEATRIVERIRSIERATNRWSDATSIGIDRPSHTGGHTTNDQIWNSEIDDALARSSKRSEPKATAKKIASSDRLIKDPDLLRIWRTVLKGVSAVEMESAGVYIPCQRNGVPVLAIRGISDIIGWRRDEAWTLYACHTSAAFARMLVEAGAFSELNQAST